MTDCSIGDHTLYISVQAGSERQTHTPGQQTRRSLSSACSGAAVHAPQHSPGSLAHHVCISSIVTTVSTLEMVIATILVYILQ